MKCRDETFLMNGPQQALDQTPPTFLESQALVSEVVAGPSREDKGLSHQDRGPCTVSHSSSFILT